MTTVADRFGLNDEQREALAALGTPLRVVAGPGTGKTRTVVAMYLHLLEERDARPGNVLVLTFSNNAAAQLTSRIDAHLRGSYDESWVSTFHSFATRVLTRWGGTHGVAPFVLMNGFQERLLMRRVLHDLDDVSLGGLAPLRRSEALVQDALWFIGILKQNLVRADGFEVLAASSGRRRLVDLAAICRAYWRAQEAQRLWDFRDVIAQCHDLLAGDAALREELSSKFRHVIVDEYQDVDSAQVNLLRQLVSAHQPRPRIAVVGDPNQSIYGFRGTLPLHIREAWPFGGREIVLRESYRSYEQVLDAADALLGGWDARPERLVATRGRAAVDVVAVDHERTASDEAASVARQVRELIDDGTYAPSEIAVILRSTRRSGRVVEEALFAAGVAVASSGSPSFASSDVVRFCVTALRALAEPGNDDHLVHVLDSAFVAVPAVDGRRLLAEAARRRTALGDELRTISLLTVLQHTCFLLAAEDPARWPLPWTTDGVAAPTDATPEALAAQEDIGNATANDDAAPTAPPRVAGEFFAELSDAGRDAIHRFTWTWGRLVGLAPKVTPHALLGRVVEELGVVGAALDPALGEERRGEVTGPLRLMTRALTELDDITTRLDGHAPDLATTIAMLDQVLPDYTDELEPPDTAEPGVRLLTVHGSKGLEFPVVFMPALAAQRFPVVARARTPLLDGDDQAWMERELTGFAPPWPRSDADFLAEEARLGYVAATRARDVLRLSWADEYERGEPATKSVFVEPLGSAGAIDREYVELHRVPPGPTSSAPLTMDEAAAANGWSAWSRPVRFLEGTTDSATSVAKYLQCPRKYFYYKALGLESESGPAARRGSAFHKVMERFHAPACEARWRPSLPDITAARREYDLIAAEEVDRYLRGVAGVVRRNAEGKRMRHLLTTYFENERAYFAASTTIDTERRFTWSAADDIVLYGMIDRILRYDGSGVVEITDYKTGAAKTAATVREMLGLAADKPASDLQLLIYLGAARAGAVEDVDPEQVEVVGLWYPRDVFKNPAGIKKLRVVRDPRASAGLPHDIAAGKQLVLAPGEEAAATATLTSTLRAMRAGDFPPAPVLTSYTCLSAWGSGCEYAWVCPGRIREPQDFVPE